VGGTRVRSDASGPLFLVAEARVERPMRALGQVLGAAPDAEPAQGNHDAAPTLAAGVLTGEFGSRFRERS
jgi:hypothetical protein